MPWCLSDGESEAMIPIRPLFGLLGPGLALLLVCWPLVAEAAPLRVAVVAEGDSPRASLAVDEIRDEVDKLLDHREVVLAAVDLGSLTPPDAMEQLYRESDVVVAWGLSASFSLGARRPLTRPTLLSMVPQPELLGLVATPDGTSGIDNLAYVRVPRTLADEIATFAGLFPSNHLAVVVAERLLARPAIAGAIAQQSESAPFLVSVVGTDGETVELPEGVDAVLIGPVGPGVPLATLERWTDGWTADGLPTYMTVGRQFRELPAAAGTVLDLSRETLVRRVALSITKIAEGVPAEALSVEVADALPQLVLNVPILRRIGRFPPWRLLNEATLLGVETVQSERRLDLRAVIVEALQRNLSLRDARLSARAGEHEVGVARGALLPQVAASTAVDVIDSSTVTAARGSRSPLTWGGQLGFTQVLVSEPLWATLTIRQLMAETRRAHEDQSELDTILVAPEAYVAVLMWQAITRVQNQNVETTRHNLRIAQRRFEAGALTRSDVARWESSLALNRADLNDTLAVLAAARFRLNQLLDRPQTDTFELVELTFDDVAGGGIGRFVANPGDLDRLADLLVTQALQDVPELEQLRLSVEAQRRLHASQRSSFFVPQLALSGQLSQTFGRAGSIDLPPGVTPTEPITHPTWGLNLGLSLPLFEGAARFHRLRQGAIEVEQLELRRQALEAQLELQLRSQLQQVGAGVARIELARVAQGAAHESLASAQDAYAEGQVPISQLIDAQQGALLADLASAQARYRAILEVLLAERAVGSFSFLMSEAERRATLDIMGGAK